MNGNIDVAGLKADLDWMQRVGVGGAQIFEGGMGSPQVVPDRLIFRSPEWYDAFAAAVKTANEKGIEISVASSGGWSVLGAPWVKPEDAMKKFVWSETQVICGQSVRQLNPLPNCEGPFQDLTKWARDQRFSFGGDVACFAVPRSNNFDVLKPTSIEISRDFTGDLASLTDSKFGSWISTERDVTKVDEIFITYRFDSPTEVGSAQIGIAGPTGFGAPELAKAYLQISADGAEFTEIGAFAMSETMGQMGETAGRTLSFDPVMAKAVRLRLTGKPISASVPTMMPGVSPLPFKPKDFDKFMVSEFALHAGGKVHAAEYKAGYSIWADYFSLNKSVEHKQVIDPSTMIDVTEHVDANGVLHWAAPQGEWQIIRVGYSLTGHENGPAPVEATGLEVDKLDPDRISNYLETYFTPLYAELESRGLSATSIQAILTDSIESRSQNFTEGIFDEFEKRRGYSMRNWLPAIAGWVVGSTEATDKFLYDFRLTLSDLVADCMYRLIKEFAHSKGARYYSEALEDTRPQLGDDLQMRSHADVPMGAMWSWLAGELPQQTYLADLKGASSVAHVYGKTHTGCESFSTFGKPFVWSPQELKRVADLELALGVTLFNIHSSPHQPAVVNAPGVTLAPTLGQVFTRNETWAEMAGPWVEYIARASHVLNQGKPVAEILYFTGCEAPVTGIWGSDEFDVPSGYDFDFVSADGLLKNISAEGGRLVSAQTSYSILYLGGHSQLLTCEVLRKLDALAESGVKIFGAKPNGSPSLADSQEEFDRLVATIWGRSNVAAVGSLAKAVEIAKAQGSVAIDWQFTQNGKALDARLVGGADLRCIRRSLEGSDVYFVANAKNRSLAFEAKFSAKGLHALVIDAVDPSATPKLVGADSIELELAAYGSCFVVITDDESAALAFDFESGTLTGLIEIDEWQLEIAGEQLVAGSTFDLAANPDERVRYFSGVYSATAAFELTAEKSGSSAGAVSLALPGLTGIAEVSVNGVFVGVAWAKGQSIDLSSATKIGTNQITLKLANGWRNRLIGDQHGKAAFEGQPKTYLAYPIFEHDAQPAASGLLTPAQISF